MRKGMWIYGLGIGVSLIFVCLLSWAHAANYPQKPITLIVPYPAGGRTDLLARIFAQSLSKHFAQPVVVTNKPGAGTVLGTMEVIKAEPDGYILGIFSNGLIASHYVLPDTIQLWKELEPVAMINFDPTVMVVSEKSGFKNLKELIAFAKKNPKKLNVGINQGTATSLYTVFFMKTAGIEVTYVPFKGGGEAKIAIAGGHLDAHFDAAYTYKPLVDSQKARFMGMASERRDLFFPDIPTFKEQGVDIAWGAWHGIFSPKKTSPEIIEILERGIEKTLAYKELKDMMNKNQLAIDYKNRQQFIRFLENEDRVYKEVASEMGIYDTKK